jgi:hypothetical protein
VFSGAETALGTDQQAKGRAHRRTGNGLDQRHASPLAKQKTSPTPDIRQSLGQRAGFFQNGHAGTPTLATSLPKTALPTFPPKATRPEVHQRAFRTQKGHADHAELRRLLQGLFQSLPAGRTEVQSKAEGRLRIGILGLDQEAELTTAEAFEKGDGRAAAGVRQAETFTGPGA